MRVIEVQNYGGPDVLKEAERENTKPLEQQIKIEVKAAGINFADLMARAGLYPGGPKPPFVPGFEVAGIVTELGAEVSKFKVGERVMGLLFNYGGYASSAILEADTVISLPDKLGFAEATALLVQGLTALFLLEEAGSSNGKSILIPGAAGGVGSLAIQLAKIKGASKIIALASPNKHDLVKSLGADLAIDYTKAGWSKVVLENTESKGVDIFLDSQGDFEGEGFATLAPGAHWMIYGAQAASNKPLAGDKLWALLGKNLTLRGYSLYGSAPHFARGLKELIELTVTNKLRINVQSFPLEEAAKVHAAIADRKTTGKVVLLP
ncbi:MAG: zinc-binding alcohol dehydrogenase family protein [Leptolyngbya sp.]|nr:zinc-binding alcohol dehydrogenase family protein [Candidatus Melainabacteria bacterium]